jgi:hypothetical protein
VAWVRRAGQSEGGKAYERGGRTDFYRVLNNDGWRCFANDGELDVFIINVADVSPSNNKGRVMTTGEDWLPWRGTGGGNLLLQLSGDRLENRDPWAVADPTSATNNDRDQ